MRAPRFTFVIPDLLPKNNNPEIDHPISELSLPSVSKMLLRADRLSSSEQGFESVLFRLFKENAKDISPAAALSASAYGLPSRHEWWIHADPVALHPEHGGVYLYGNAHLNLRSNEVAEFHDLLIPLFSELDIDFYTPKNNDWLLNIPDAPQIIASPYLDVVGKNIAYAMPKGPRAHFWQQLMTEVQMTLHSAEVNQARQSRGEDVVNGMWLWGGGQMPAGESLNWTTVFSDEALANGFCRLDEIPFQSLPCSFFPCAENLEIGGEYLIVLSELRVLAAHSLLDAWQEAMREIEDVWFAPLLTFVSEGIIDSVTFETCDGVRYRVNRNTLRRWWRRGRDLTHLVVHQ